MALADFKPVILPDGTLGPSKEEREYAENRRAEGALLELNKKYEDLNRTAKEEARQSYVSSGMTPPAEEELARQGSSSLLTKMQKKPEDTSMPAQSAPSPIFGQPEMEKEKPAEPVPPSGGTAPSVPPPDSSLAAKISQGEKKKEETPTSEVQQIADEVKQFEKSLGVKKAPSDRDLKGLLNKLEEVPIPQRTGDPNAERFLQQRAEAYRAYQRKADRNEWLDLAQSLVNSITQFASAQAAMGTRFAGGQIPLAGVDYAGRTARAAKEYEMELGGVEAAERVSTKQAEQDYLNKKEAAEVTRSNLLTKIAAEEKSLSQAQAAADRDSAQAISLYKTILDNRATTARNNAALAKSADDILAQRNKAELSAIDTTISALEDSVKGMSNKLEASNKLVSGDSKDYEKNLANYATLQGVSIDELKEQADKKSGFFTADKTWIKEQANKQARDLSAELAASQAQIEQLRRLKAEKQGGVSPSGQVAPSTPATPSTTATQPDIVTLRDPKSGQTRKVRWDETAQAKVKAGQLELVK